MEAKKLAVALGIAILLPLFIGLFIDAIYAEPKYNDFCKNQAPYTEPAKVSPTNCSTPYQGADYNQCINTGGQPVFNYTNGCEVFEKCDMCNQQFQNAQASYNRNVFFILTPVELLIVILGIYLMIDYLGAGLMFAGLITMFYATIRYFSDMSKLFRALVILLELLIIMWIAYKKIDKGKVEEKKKRK